MKKTPIYFILCILLAFLFVACGKSPHEFAPLPTLNPEVITPTVVPTATNSPTTTEAPIATETPVATQAPIATEAPVSTDAPVSTEAPVATEVPVSTNAPVATEAPIATEAPVTTKAPTQSSAITVDFHDLSYLTSYDMSYYVKNDGSIDLQFDGQYKEIKFTLPEAVDLNYCERITVKAISEYANLTVKLYDDTLLADAYCGEVFRKYDCMGKGVVEYELYPDVTTEIHGIGLMSLDEVADNSKYKATVYNITFHMLPGYDKASSGDSGIGTANNATLLNTYGNVFGKLGTCVSLWQLQNTSLLNQIKTQYNSVTSENEMKPDALLGGSPTLISVDEAKKIGYVIPSNYKESTVPRINFSNVDKILEICAKNGLGYRAHTLVWHSQTPNWFFRTGYSDSGSFVSKEVMNARMEFYIRTVMTHVYDNQYSYVVYSWDVVNEYLHATQIPNWIRIYGNINTTPDFVKLAFEIADDVLEDYGIRDDVALIFNDYNTYIDTHKYLAIMEFINSDKKICDGFGMQAHLDTGYPTPTAFKNTVNTFLNTGLEVQITELDVTTNNAASQEKYYYDLMSYLLEIMKKGGKITGLTYWGLGDSNSWRGNQKPLLFSAPGKPKNVYYKVLQAYTDAGYTVE